MREAPEVPKVIDAFIEPIVEAAQIPSRRRRDELRRELRNHFEDSGLTAEALDEAVARFGNPAGVGDSLRNVYRRDYLLFYLVKIAACTAAAAVTAIAIEAIANLRLAGDAAAWQLSPGFTRGAGFGVVLTLALVAAVEATRTPFRWRRALVSLGCYAMVSACASLVNANSFRAFVTASILAVIGVGVTKAVTAWPSKALLTLAGFAATEYVLHQSLGITFGPMRALAASAILLMLWASTITIVACSDRAFVSAFRTT
jgi:hypothetical protein